MLQSPTPCACLWNVSIWLTLYIATKTAPIIIPSRLPISEEQLTTYFTLYFLRVRMLRWYMTFLLVVIQLELQKGFFRQDTFQTSASSLSAPDAGATRAQACLGTSKEDNLEISKYFKQEPRNHSLAVPDRREQDFVWPCCCQANGWEKRGALRWSLMMLRKLPKRRLFPSSWGHFPLLENKSPGSRTAYKLFIKDFLGMYQFINRFIYQSSIKWSSQLTHRSPSLCQAGTIHYISNCKGVGILWFPRQRATQ